MIANNQRRAVSVHHCPGLEKCQQKSTLALGKCCNFSPSNEMTTAKLSSHNVIVEERHITFS
jgi:hypothetical protein